MSQFKDFVKYLIGALIDGYASNLIGNMLNFPTGTGGGMHGRNRSAPLTSKRRGSSPQGYYGRPRWGRTLNGGI